MTVFRWLILFYLLTCNLAWCQLAQADIHPKRLIYNCVDVVTGRYLEEQVDLEPVEIPELTWKRYLNGFDRQDFKDSKDKVYPSMGRLHTSNHNLGFWVQQAHVQLSLPSGTQLRFHLGKYTQNKESFLHPRDVFEVFPEKNTPQLNQARLQFKGKKATLSLPGSYFYYYSSKTNLSQRSYYRLDSVLLPNGNHLHYRYNPKEQLEKVILLSQKGRQIAYLKMDYNSKGFLVQIADEMGQKVLYQYDAWGRLSGVKSTKNPDETHLWHYESGSWRTQKEGKRIWHDGKITYTLHKPDGRYVEVEFYDYDTENPFARGKVKAIWAPAKEGGEKIALYRFDYRKENKKWAQTFVWDALGGFFTYHYDVHLHEIQHYKMSPRSQILSLYQKERFFWTKEGCLKSHSLENEKGETFFAKVYDYNAQYLVTKEKTYGRASKRGEHFFEVDEKGHPKGFVEKREISRSYSKDGRGLLILEKKQGLSTRYLYDKKRVLLDAKFESTGDKIFKREFFTYNDAGRCIEKIKDDGSKEEKEKRSGVTVCEWSKWKRHMGGGFSELCEVFERFFLDLKANEWKLKDKVKYHYLPQRIAFREDIYDTEDHFKGYLHRQVDEKGRVLTFLDQIGRYYHWKYDANGNVLERRFPKKDRRLLFSYDSMNRLLLKTYQEINLDDEVLSERKERYTYDPFGNILRQYDEIGRSKRYLYNSLGQCVSIIYPKTLNEDDQWVRPSKHFSYDLMGFCHKEVDEKNHKTVKEFNVFGQILYQKNPDGSWEENHYDPRGFLKESQNSQGLAKKYMRDAQGRILEEKSFSNKGRWKSQHWDYNPLHLVSHRDHMGVGTFYHYNFFGQLIKKERGDKSFRIFSYDSLGNRVYHADSYGPRKDQLTFHVVKNDPMGRVVEKRVENASGEILWKQSCQYDDMDKITEKRQWENAEKSIITSLNYNAYNELTTYKNASGQRFHKTRTFEPYKDDVLMETICIQGPDGKKLVAVYDFFGRLLERKILSSEKQVLNQQIHRYDASGHLVRLYEPVFFDVLRLRTERTAWEYGPSGRVEKKILHHRTPFEWTCSFHYDEQGKLYGFSIEDQKFSIDYDQWGRISKLFDQRGTASSYSYDRMGNLTQFVDRRGHLVWTCMRKYDERSRLIQETLGNGLKFTYQYDDQDRLIQITLPDQSQLSYLYDALYLRQFTRLDGNAKERYRYVFDRIDQRGKVLKTKATQAMGGEVFSFNEQGQILESNHYAFRQKVYPEDIDFMGNVQRIRFMDHKDVSSFQYSYDALGRLEREVENISLLGNYRYDSRGELIKQKERAYLINQAGQLMDDGLSRYHYNKKGQLIQRVTGKKIHQYAYDALGNLIKMEIPREKKVQWICDSLGRRLFEESFHWNDTEGVWERDEKKRAVYFFDAFAGYYDTHGLKELGLFSKDGQTLGVELEDKIYGVVKDYRKNIRALIHPQTGSIDAFYRYNALGDVETFSSGKEKTNKDALGNHWLFKGRRLDPHLGFYMQKKGGYNPVNGRFFHNHYGSLFQDLLLKQFGQGFPSFFSSYKDVIDQKENEKSRDLKDLLSKPIYTEEMQLFSL